jgi:probable rRNA maturation factor
VPPAVAVTGRHAPLSGRAVAETVRYVLGRERRRAAISVAFVGPGRIRRLNAAWKGADRPTDVLAFSLPQPGGGLAGDIYICRAVAQREARARRIGLGRELRRLVIHGTLHVLGWDHPDGDDRTSSPMWRRQERYLACLD